MTPEQNQRFEMLQAGSCVPVSYLNEYYGLPLHFSEPADHDFDNFLSGFHPSPCPPAMLSRYALETFMSRNNWLPRKWMAAALGMTESSLDMLLLKLGDLGMQVSRYVLGDEFVAESLSDDLIRHISGLRFRTFGSHTAFCVRLHDELKDEIGLEVETLYCTTSIRMKENERKIAAYFDCFTLEPLSKKHSIWLDFHKPLNLPPDRCSKLFYVENREILRPFIAGSSEPGGLKEYESFIEQASTH